MADNTKKKKGLMSGFDKIVLFLALGILAYVALQRGGFKVTEKAEEVTIVDNPHSKEGNQKKRVYTPPPKAERESVDRILDEIARLFSDSGQAETDRLKEMGLEEDEAEYLSDVKTRHEFDESIQNAKDWLSLLKTSHSTYQKVKSMFEEIDQQAVEKEKLDGIMRDQSEAEEVYSKMKDLFGISNEDVTEFARKGKSALRDWAEFVEEQQEKKTIRC